MPRKKSEAKPAETPTDSILRKYPEALVEDVRKNLGLEEGDPSCDEQIDRMSRAEFLDRVLTWNGLVSYGETIRQWVGDVYGLTIGDDHIAFNDEAEGKVVYHDNE